MENENILLDALKIKLKVYKEQAQEIIDRVNNENNHTIEAIIHYGNKLNQWNLLINELRITIWEYEKSTNHA